VSWVGLILLSALNLSLKKPNIAETNITTQIGFEFNLKMSLVAIVTLTLILVEKKRLK